MKNIKAVFIKQFQSLLKNPVMLAQALFYLVLILIITFLVGTNDDIECHVCIPAYVCATCLEANPPLDVPTPSITGLFTVLFVGLAMVGAASALVVEDKTTKNLRFMTMAKVKPKEYLIGTAASMASLSFVVLLLFAIVGRYFGVQMLWFMAVTGFGAVVSMLFGITLGLSKYPYLTTPLSLIVGMGPMLSSFNETLAHALRFTYTQQINLAVSDFHSGYPLDLTNNFLIIGANGLVVLVLFVWMLRKGSLD